MQDVKWLKGYQEIYKIEPVQKYSDMSGLILKQTLIRIKNACDASIQDVIFKLT